MLFSVDSSHHYKTKRCWSNQSGEWVFLTSEEDFFFVSQRFWLPPVHLLSGGERAECSPALSGASISSGAPCGRANSACLTSGTSWSTDINNTPFFPSPCMFRPFGSHHEVHLCPSPSRRYNAYALRVNDRVTVYGLQLTALARRDRLTSGGTIFILSATPEIFINTTHHPLINYTPAMGAPSIMNVFPIRTKAIDFCHSFEMDLLEGTLAPLSFNLSKQTSP